MKCANCGATSPTRSSAGTAVWHTNRDGIVVCSPYCAGFYDKRTLKLPFGQHSGWRPQQ